MIRTSVRLIAASLAVLRGGWQSAVPALPGARRRPALLRVAAVSTVPMHRAVRDRIHAPRRRWDRLPVRGAATVYVPCSLRMAHTRAHRRPATRTCDGANPASRAAGTPAPAP